MRNLKVIIPYTLFMIVVIILVFFQDSYTIIHLADYRKILSSNALINSNQYLTYLNFNMAINIAVFGFSGVIISIVFSRVDITIKDYLRHFLVLSNCFSLFIISLIAIIISLCFSYFRYTNTVDLWLKISNIIPIHFFVSIVNMTFKLEQQDDLKSLLIRLTQRMQDHVKLNNYIHKVLIPVMKDKSYDILLEAYKELRDQGKDPIELFKIVEANDE